MTRNHADPEVAGDAGGVLPDGRRRHVPSQRRRRQSAFAGVLDADSAVTNGLSSIASSAAPDGSLADDGGTNLGGVRWSA